MAAQEQKPPAASVRRRAVAIMAPAIVPAMIFQKYVVKGPTMGAVKG